MKTTTLSGRSAVLATLATAAVVLAMPAGALAAYQHAPAHHRTRHAAKSRHAGRARVIHVGSRNGTSGSGEGTAEPGTAAPTATVVSFRGGILKVKLIGGSVLTGRVRAATRVSCAPAPSVEVEPVAEEVEGEPGTEGAGEEEPQEEDTQVEPTETCTKADLTHGAAISDALLAVGSHSSTWTRIELSY